MMETQDENMIREDDAGQGEASPRQRRRAGRKKRYNGLLVKNIPFYFFLAAIAVFYIANGHYADKMVRETIRTEKKLTEMNFDYKVVKREVTFRSKQSELARVVAPLGLEELLVPPVIIKDTIK